jgi:hypothetical protein
MKAEKEAEAEAARIKAEEEAAEAARIKAEEEAAAEAARIKAEEEAAAEAARIKAEEEAAAEAARIKAEEEAAVEAAQLKAAEEAAATAEAARIAAIEEAAAEAEAACVKAEEEVVAAAVAAAVATAIAGADAESESDADVPVDSNLELLTGVLTPESSPADGPESCFTPPAAAAAASAASLSYVGAVASEPCEGAALDDDTSNSPMDLTVLATSDSTVILDYVASPSAAFFADSAADPLAPSTSFTSDIETSVSTSAPRLHLALPTPTKGTVAGSPALETHYEGDVDADVKSPPASAADVISPSSQRPMSTVHARHSRHPSRAFDTDGEDDASAVADAVNSMLIHELRQPQPASVPVVPRSVETAAVDARLSQRMKTFTKNRFQMAADEEREKAAAAAASQAKDKKAKEGEEKSPVSAPKEDDKANAKDESKPESTPVAAAPSAAAESSWSIWPWILAAVVAGASARYYWRRQ